MATKAVKILDKNFHIPLKLNDLLTSVAVGLRGADGNWSILRWQGLKTQRGMEPFLPSIPLTDSL
jgi:hypothetical protein